jgi:IQ and AAA domain-containing protein
MANYDDAKEMILEEIDANERTTIMEDMLKDRREWVTDYRRTHGGKVPDDLELFHKRFDVEDPKKGDGSDSDDDGKGKKGKKGGGKKAPKGKKKKGKGGKDEPGIIKVGPSETVRHFETFYQNYNQTWATRDESENYKQEYDHDLCREEMEPVLKKRYNEEIDEMLKIELENMKLLSGVKAKKKKGKKKKAKKKKKGKGLKLPGYKQIKNRVKTDLLCDLIQNNIVKKLPAQQLTDFFGEFNYIHSMLDDVKQPIHDPSMALIRQLVTEYIIFPLGSELVRTRFRDKCTSYLFYGPPGTGKTLVVRSCITETNSVLFDLSPENINGKYPEKDQNKVLIASTMVVAKEYQPSIIYIDECEKVFPAKKKKGKKKGGKKKLKISDPMNPARIKKTIAKWKKSAKFFEDKTRITILGCTSNFEDGSKKDFKKFFDKQIYFPFPDYNTRRMMWRNFIERHEGKLKQDFPLQTLAHISSGYSAGSIKQTCEKVLTTYRIKLLDHRPLTI